MDLLCGKMDKSLIKSEPEERVDITTPVAVASYNWLNAEEPTIAVPGEYSQACSSNEDAC